MLQLSVSQMAAVIEATDPEELEDVLLSALLDTYQRVLDLPSASLEDIWLLVRDLTTALERIRTDWGGLSGAEKLDLAEGLLWRFIEVAGGWAALKRLVVGSLKRIRYIGGGASWIAQQLLSASMLRALVRYTLELAVRELRIRTV